MSDIAESTSKSSLWSRGTARAAVAALALIIVADLLLYASRPGVGLFLFFAAVAVALLALSSRTLRERRVVVGAAIAVLGALPFIETPSFWALLTALGGVSVLALAARGELPQSPVDLPGALLRFGIVAPLRFIADGFGLLGAASRQKFGGRLLRGVIVWVVPLACAGIFLLLFSSANPLIEGVLKGIRIDALFELFDPGRVFFWGVIAVTVWPLLRPQLLGWRPVSPMQGPVLPQAENLFFGRGAILRSLIVFNALFAVQSVLDLAYLWGGVRLPDGMSHADYAHRGAYPLVLTALLAAAFVLAAMRKGGPGEGSPLIRQLVYVWIAQNVLLVISSILRLDLYVKVYSLTELRIAAGIWMGLVAVGLVLIPCRIVWNKSNKWLIAINLGVLGLTLYAAAFTDFSAIIARFNVDNSIEVTGAGQPLDLWYLSALGPSTLPALDDFIRTIEPENPSRAAEAREMRRLIANDFAHRTTDWRSWTWRDMRTAAYLAAVPKVARWPQDVIN